MVRGNHNNILGKGYRTKRPNGTARYVHGLHSSESWHHNSTTASLTTSPGWQALLAIVGDMLMLHLLQHSTIFVSISSMRCNYLQVTGRPIAEVVRMKANDAANEMEVTPWLTHQHQGPKVEQQLPPRDAHASPQPIVHRSTTEQQATVEEAYPHPIVHKSTIEQQAPGAETHQHQGPKINTRAGHNSCRCFCTSLWSMAIAPREATAQLHTTAQQHTIAPRKTTAQLHTIAPRETTSQLHTTPVQRPQASRPYNHISDGSTPPHHQQYTCPGQSPPAPQLAASKGS
eukprot:gene23536-9060_t